MALPWIEKMHGFVWKLHGRTWLTKSNLVTLKPHPALLRLWLNEDTENGMDLRLFGGKMFRLQVQHMGFLLVTLRLKGLPSIFEGQLASSPVFGAKTLLLRDNTGFFHQITCAENFQLSIASDPDIFSAIDHLATIAFKKRDWNNWRNHLVSVGDLTDFGMILLYEIACLQAICWEIQMHIFWANGTMSSELNLFMMAFQKRFGSMGLLTDALLGIGFESAGKGAKTAHVKKLLNHKLFSRCHVQRFCTRLRVCDVVDLVCNPNFADWWKSFTKRNCKLLSMYRTVPRNPPLGILHHSDGKRCTFVFFSSRSSSTCV